ncbi:MAG: hypothetical protein LKJ90_00675 [Faecalibacterium sp.]|nr:hypothetical protein [Faecalibacterium sp.]
MHIRTINGAAQELRRRDPDCAITANCIRSLCAAQAVPSRKAGSRWLVDVDAILAYFRIAAPSQPPEAPPSVSVIHSNKQ